MSTAPHLVGQPGLAAAVVDAAGPSSAAAERARQSRRRGGGSRCRCELFAIVARLKELTSGPVWAVEPARRDFF